MQVVILTLIYLKYSSEAEFIKTIAINLGVPENRIICEDKASHSFENAVFSLEMLKRLDMKIEKFIIVCKASHSRRALLTYQSIFPSNVKFLVSPTTEKSGLNRENWVTKPEYISKVMGEVEKLESILKIKFFLCMNEHYKLICRKTCRK